jgi:hypothetical protein
MHQPRIYHSLVEQDDIGLPNLVRGQTEDADAAVVSLVPAELIVIPNLEIDSRVTKKKKRFSYNYATITYTPAICNFGHY